MAKTEFKPKVTSIRQDENQANSVKNRGKTTKANTVSDGYTKATSNDYRSLLSGNSAKANEISQLSDAINATTDSRNYSDPVQDILNSMLMGESAMATGPNVYEHEMPHVPDLEQEIFIDDPERIYNMAPVVQRYAALETTLKELLWSNEAQLDTKYMSKMTTDEIATLKIYKEALVNALRECRMQLRKARMYHAWQIQDEKAAAAVEE